MASGSAPKNKNEAQAPGRDLGSNAGGAVSFQVSGLAGAGARGIIVRPDGEPSPPPPTRVQQASSPVQRGPKGPSSGSSESKAEVSAIHGLKDKSHHLSAISSALINNASFAAERKTTRRLLLTAYGCAFIAIVAICIVVPDINRLVHQVGDYIVAVGHGEDPRTLVFGSSSSATTKVGSRAGSSAASCAATLQAGMGGGAVALRDLVIAGECYLLADSYAQAETTLRPLRAELQKTPEAVLNQFPTRTPELAQGMLLIVFAGLKQGRYADVDQFLKNWCKTWTRSATCVAKYFSYVHRDLLSSSADAFKKIQGTKQNLDRTTESYLLVAAGKMAAKQENARAADGFFEEATKTVPSASLHLKRQIYESYALSLYERGEKVRARAVIKRSMAALAGMHPSSRYKLRLINDLADAKIAPKALATFLTRDELSHRARQDMEMLQLIGPEAIKYRRLDEFIHLLQAAGLQMRQNPEAAPEYALIPTLWEIRANIANLKPAQAIRLIEASKRRYGRTDLLGHLHGVALLSAATNRVHFEKAVHELRSISARTPSWESLYALGAALIRSGKVKQATPIVERLESVAHGRTQNYWATMLKAEYMIAQHKPKPALVVLGPVMSREPQSFLGNRLLANAYGALGDKRKASEIELKIDDLGRKTSYLSSREGLSSPVGALALTRRPTE